MIVSYRGDNNFDAERTLTKQTNGILRALNGLLLAFKRQRRGFVKLATITIFRSHPQPH
jgi:hypothetical protein